MADMQRPQHPKEKLTAMLNLVLLQTSKILRDPDSRNPTRAGPTRTRITKIVNAANQEFHDALDEIEFEILQAKAVMERDLRVIRKKRAERDRERDRANGIPSPTTLAKEGNGAPIENSSTTHKDAQIQESQGPNVPLVEDYRDLDALNSQEKGASTKSDEGKVIGSGQGMPQDSANSAGLAITMPTGSTLSAIDQQKNAGKQPADSNATPEPALDMPDAADLDFESMFNDTDLGGTDDTFGGLDFSMDPAMNQDILNDSTLQHSTTSNVDMTTMASTSNEDINSLLPGLENYVNAGTVFSNIGMAGTSSQSETAQAASVATTNVSTADVPATDATPTVPTNTNFDDFFGYNFDVNETGADDIEDGTLGEFDDFDWDAM